MSTNFAPPAPLDTAVLFLVFNRPDVTAQVFDAIRQAKPPRLYVAADGPRHGRAGEVERVAQVRAIATAVDWPCEVRTLFRDKNLGCKAAVSGGITWFFGQEEQGIILEDDCLPNQSFFWFCEELLNRYADENAVSTITGDNFQRGVQRGEGTYYFSRYNHVWGWASWRRAWRYYNGELLFWPEWKKSEGWTRAIPDKVERRYWTKIFDLMFDKQIDTWDYPWMASVWFNGGLTATPTVNLVSNIGHGADATHTLNANSPLAEMATTDLGVIEHLPEVIQDIEADRYVFDHHFGGRSLRFPRNLWCLPVGIARSFYRRFERFLFDSIG
jgi:hypothetical protein